MSEGRTLLVDASVFITLAEIDAVELLHSLRGDLVVPAAVRAEISDDPAHTILENSIDDGLTTKNTGKIRETKIYYSDTLSESRSEVYEDSARRLGKDPDDTVESSSPLRPSTDGDVALLTEARLTDDVVVLTDDKPLRKTCASLSIPVSGTIGVLVRAVETGDLDSDEAKTKLYAMDEVGARLSASLVKRAERLIDDAGD